MGDDCDVVCGDRGVMFQGLPGKGELYVDCLGWRDTGLGGMEEWSGDWLE